MTDDRNTPWDPKHTGEPTGGPTGQTPGPGQDGFQQNAEQQPGYHGQPPFGAEQGTQHAQQSQGGPYAAHGQPPYGGPGQGDARYGQPPHGGFGNDPYGREPQSGGSRTPLWIALGVLAVLLIGALIFFLTRGDDDNDAASDPTPTAVEDATDEGPDVEDGGRAPEDAPDQEFGDPNADPAAFRSGMEDILAESGLDQQAAEDQGITSDQWNAYLDCVTDEAIQRLRPDAIESISNGTDVYDNHSVTELEDIAMQCGEEAGTL